MRPGRPRCHLSASGRAAGQARSKKSPSQSQDHQTEDQAFIGKALEKLGLELTVLGGVPSCPIRVPISNRASASLRQGAVMRL